MGAGQWEEHYSKALKGRHVRIIPYRAALREPLGGGW
jgi:hypothetical protein